MRLSLTPAIVLGVVGTLHLLNSAVAAPLSGVSSGSLSNRGLPPIKGGGSGGGKGGGGKGDKDLPDFPIGGGSLVGGGSRNQDAPGSWGDLASGAGRSTREKGTVEDNIANIHVEADPEFPLTSSNSARGNPAYLTGIVDADKKWNYNQIFKIENMEGDPFFTYAASAQERAVIIRSAHTKVGDDPVADAARTYKARDIIMDGWIKEANTAGVPVSSLKYVVRDDIQTVSSKEAIDTALTNAGRDRAVKNEFGVNVPADKAAFDLLTTGNVHGNGITKMVQVNHVDLADMQIVKVAVWTPATKDSRYYALAFELGHV